MLQPIDLKQVGRTTPPPPPPHTHTPHFEYKVKLHGREFESMQLCISKTNVSHYDALVGVQDLNIKRYCISLEVESSTLLPNYCIISNPDKKNA